MRVALDVLGRAIADRLAASLKQTFIVENRVGAAGNTGSDAAAKAEPDGHTLLLVLSSTLTVNLFQEACDVDRIFTEQVDLLGRRIDLGICATISIHSV